MHMKKHGILDSVCAHEVLFLFFLISSIRISFLKFYFLIGRKLLYSVVLVSAVQQCKSAITIHISLPSWCSTLCPLSSTLTRPSEHNSAAVSSRKPSLTGLKLAQLPSRITGFQALQSPTRVLSGPAF